MTTSKSTTWPTYPLTELYDISSGLSKPRSEFGAGEGFLSFKDVLDNYFVPSKLSSLVRSSELEQQKCSVKRGDVFLTRTSETMEDLGMSSVALKDYPTATFNGFTKRLRPRSKNTVVPEYAAYYFRSHQFRTAVTSMSSLSTRASLNNEMLSRLTITLPPVGVQEQIGQILKAFDDKIELNRRMNETLEAMVRRLFKSWFVDFDPVKAKAALRENHPKWSNERLSREALPSLDPKVAELFPDAFEESELGEIPKGWRTMSLDKIAHYQNGLALQKFRPKEGETSLPIVKIAQLKAGKATYDELASPSIKPECVIDDGDVVFSWSGSLMLDYWCGGKAALNQHLFKVTSHEYPKWFFAGWTAHHLDVFQRIAADKAVTMGHIKREHLSQAICLVPTSQLIDCLSPMFESLVERSITARCENRDLELSRDKLLPKLLSGQLLTSSNEVKKHE